MRIALIAETFLPDVNGVVTTLCRLLEYLRDHGHEALLFAPHGSPTSYAGAEVVPLRGVPLPLYPELKLTPPQPGITAHLHDFRPDLLHLAGTFVLGPIGCTVGRQLGLPLVASYHTDFPAYSAYYGLGPFGMLVYRYLRWFHNRCTLTLCPSSATLADLRSHGFRRLRLWGRGVDIECFHPRHRSRAWRESVGVQPGERLLLYVGRLAAEKRLDLLVQALYGLERTRLVLVGDGPARAALERAFAGLPVAFTGYLHGETLSTAYASADLFVFPSDSETFGQAIQEAMASGLPVVGARAGGALDLVREGVTGAFFAPGSAVELHVRLRELLSAPDSLAALGRAGRAAAEQRSWDKILDQLVLQYQVALRCRVRPRLRIAPPELHTNLTAAQLHGPLSQCRPGLEEDRRQQIEVAADPRQQRPQHLLAQRRR
ncbi:MAG TPA: glycosyltransferase family 1 protein [Roseiflexaceae bacterium]